MGSTISTQEVLGSLKMLAKHEPIKEGASSMASGVLPCLEFLDWR